MKREVIRETLKRHEGLRLKPYMDTVGKLTVGYGRNLTNRGISREEAEFLLDNDITAHWVELVKARPWVERLDEARQHVLLDMAFNLGVPGLLKFVNTLNAVREGRYLEAASGIRASRYCNQVGRRCEENAQIMESGNADA